MIPFSSFLGVWKIRKTKPVVCYTVAGITWGSLIQWLMAKDLKPENILLAGKIRWVPWSFETQVKRRFFLNWRYISNDEISKSFLEYMEVWKNYSTNFCVPCGIISLVSIVKHSLKHEQWKRQPGWLGYIGYCILFTQRRERTAGESGTKAEL